MRALSWLVIKREGRWPRFWYIGGCIIPTHLIPWNMYHTNPPNICSLHSPNVASKLFLPSSYTTSKVWSRRPTNWRRLQVAWYTCPPNICSSHSPNIPSKIFLKFIYIYHGLIKEAYQLETSASCMIHLQSLVNVQPVHQWGGLTCIKWAGLLPLHHYIKIYLDNLTTHSFLAYLSMWFIFSESSHSPLPSFSLSLRLPELSLPPPPAVSGH